MKGMRVECDTIAIPTVEALEKRMSELEKRVAALEERIQERPGEALVVVPIKIDHSQIFAQLSKKLATGLNAATHDTDEEAPKL